MKNNMIGKRRLAQAIMAVMVSGLGAYANANELTLRNNGLTISNNNTTIATAVLSNAVTETDKESGLLTTTSLPQITVTSGTLSSGIPTFSFNVDAFGTVTPGSHTFKVGLIIEDEASPTTRRFEAYIGQLILTVSTGGAVTGTIPSQDMVVAAVKGSVSFKASLNNATENGPVSVSGSTITLSGSQAVTELRSRNNAVINTVLNDFALNGTFTFRVVVEEVAASAVTVSLANGTDLAKVNGNALFLSGLLSPANTFSASTSAFAIKGRFQAVPAPATGGGTTTPTVTESVTAITGGATAVSGATTPAAGASAIGNVATNLGNIANQVQAGTTLTAAQVTTITNATNDTLNASTAVLTSALAAGNTAALDSAIDNIVTLLDNLTAARIPATDALLATVQTVAVAAVNAIVRSTLGTGATEAQIATALSTNQVLLDNVLSSALPVPPIVIRTQAEVTTGIQAGLPAGTPASVATKLAQIVTGRLLAPDSFRSAGGQSVGALLRSLLGVAGISAPLQINDERNGTVLAATAGQVGIVTDEASGVVKITLPNESYAGMISSIKAVSSSVPTGIRIRRDGSALIVTGNVAIELAPVSLGFLGFAAAVENSGYGFNLRDDGSLSFDLGQGNRFAGVFAYDNLTGKDLSVACGTVTIVSPTAAETSPNYAFGVNCSSGVQQRVVPYVDNANFFTALDAGSIPFSVDRNTGIITSTGNGRFKPSFFVSPRTTAETTFHTANKNAQGIAFQALDVNGDGRMDFKVIGENGTQVLFGVN